MWTPKTACRKCRKSLKVGWTWKGTGIDDAKPIRMKLEISESQNLLEVPYTAFIVAYKLNFCNLCILKFLFVLLLKSQQDFVTNVGWANMYIFYQSLGKAFSVEAGHVLCCWELVVVHGTLTRFTCQVCPLPWNWRNQGGAEQCSPWQATSSLTQLFDPLPDESLAANKHVALGPHAKLNNLLTSLGRKLSQLNVWLNYIHIV